MKKTIYDSIYRVEDLALASALKSAGAEMIRIEPQQGKRVTFVFKDDESIEAVVNAFWAGQLPVDALTYFNTLKTLKSQIYSLNHYATS